MYTELFKTHSSEDKNAVCDARTLAGNTEKKNTLKNTASILEYCQDRTIWIFDNIICSLFFNVEFALTD